MQYQFRNCKYPESIYIENLRVFFDSIGYKLFNEIKEFPKCVGGLREEFVTSIKLV